MKHLKSLTLILVAALSVDVLSAAGYLEVRAPGYGFQSAEYTTSHVFVDEVAGTTAAIEVLFTLTGYNNITDVEVYTNLNRRHLARIDKNGDGYADGIQSIAGSTVTDSGADTDSTTGHYYIPVNMSDGDANKIYELTIPAAKTGAYRLTARFKTSDAIAENGFNPNNWIWYGLRDHAIVVSPVDARDVRLYEINVFNIDASGDTFAQRSTLEDLHDAPGATHNAANRWNLDYLKSLGMNWLWFQPIHPNGIDGREVFNGSPYDPGSPYAVKNFFAVNELMTVNYSGGNSLDQNRAAAMTAWQNFVSAADAKEVGIMLDAPFNHTAFDVELAQQGVNLFQRDGETWSPLDQIRNRDARFFSQNGNYANRASSAANIAAGPDRFDFGKWNDVKDVFFGRYDALVEVDSEPERSSYKSEGDWLDTSDSDWTAADFTQGGQSWNLTRRVWDYFAEYAVHWLEKTRPAGQNRNSATEAGLSLSQRYDWDARGIDGLRCDFGQGLPPQAWEYMINVARSYKWNFVMMSESLDGGEVTYRSNRHFDILNENIVFPLKSATSKTDYRNIFEGRRTAYGQGLVLLNNTSHDEASFTDPWEAVVRSAATGMIDGSTMIFPGQELGIAETFGYSHYELNFGKNVPHFKRWNSMKPIWDDTNFGNDQLFPVYAGIQSARASSPALRSSNRWFLDGDGNNSKIFSVAKYERVGVSPAVQDVVLAFANIDRNNSQADNFKIPAGLATNLGLKDGRTYNVKNIAAYENAVNGMTGRRNVWLWGSGYTGAQLKSAGFFLSMNKVPTMNSSAVGTDPAWNQRPYEAQYLRVYDVSLLPAPASSPTVAAYALDGSVTFTWPPVADPEGLLPIYRLTVTRSDSVVQSFETTLTSYTVTGLPSGVTATGSVVTLNPNNVGVASSATSSSSPTLSLTSAGDNDGDGMNNASEITAGTSPVDPASLLRIISVGSEVGGGTTITWEAIPGKIYRVEATGNLVTGPWTSIATNLTTGTYTDSNPGPGNKFYRVKTGP